MSTFVDIALDENGATRSDGFLAPPRIVTDHFFLRLGGNRVSLALADQAIVSCTNFLTSVAVARIGGRAELGLYLLAWTITTVVNEILTAAIATPYNVISPTLNTQCQKRYRGSMIIQQFVLSAICAACLMGVSVEMKVSNLNAGLLHVLGTLACLVVVLVFREFVRRMYFAHLEMKEALLADVSSCVLQLTIVGVLVATDGLSASTTYWAIGAAAIVPCIMWTWRYRHQVKFDSRSALIDFQQNWTLSKWLIGSGALWSAAMYAYPWILTLTHGASSTGAWAACYGLAALANPVALGFGNYLGPKISLLYAHEGVAAMCKYVYRSSVLFAGLLSPPFLVTWIWGNALVGHLYGPTFLGHTVAIRILAANVLVWGAVFPFSRGFFALRRADLDLAVNVLAIAILFSFGFGLVRSYGVIGAAIGLTLTNCVTAVARAATFRLVTLKMSRSHPGAHQVPAPS